AAGLPQAQVFAAGVQTEVGVKRGSRPPAVLSRGKHDQETIRRHIRGWEAPFGKVARRIGKKPAGQVHRIGAAVKDLDPIRVSAVFVPQSTGVAGRKLGNSYLLRADRLRRHYQQTSESRSTRKSARKTAHTTSQRVDLISPRRGVRLRAICMECGPLKNLRSAIGDLRFEKPGASHGQMGVARCRLFF